MKNLENDTKRITLTQEFIDKSDKDIETIRKLVEFAEETNNILVLSGGYATEALCGGKITRAHGDIDAHLILTGIKSVEVIFVGVQRILSEEDTNWILRNQKPDKLEFLEDDKHKEFDAKRRLEVRLNEPHEDNINYPRKALINSKGEKVEVNVVDLTEQAAQKIQKFYSLKEGVDTKTDRHSSSSDYHDLKRLLEHDELDIEKIRESFPKEFDYTKSLLEDFFGP